MLEYSGRKKSLSTRSRLITTQSLCSRLNLPRWMERTFDLCQNRKFHPMLPSRTSDCGTLWQGERSSEVGYRFAMAPFGILANFRRKNRRHGLFHLQFRDSLHAWFHNGGWDYRKCLYHLFNGRKSRRASACVSRNNFWHFRSTTRRNRRQPNSVNHSSTGPTPHLRALFMYWSNIQLCIHLELNHL